MHMCVLWNVCAYVCIVDAYMCIVDECALI